MKIVNEKGKLFGIINIVDLLILIVVLAAVAGIATQIFGHKVQEAVSPQVDCIAEVTVIGTPPRILREIEREDLTGERLVAGNEYLDATVEEVIVEDYVVQAVTADGRIVDATDPSKKDVTFRIKTKVSRGTPSPKIGSQELRTGKTFIVKTQTFECSGTIRYVQIDE